MTDETTGGPAPRKPSQEEKRRMKSAARLYSVQALFQMEAAGQTADEATANVLMNLGNVRLARERAAEALQLYERAAAIYERLGGARSQDLAEALENMALAHEALGADAQAQALRARVAAIRRG